MTAKRYPGPSLEDRVVCPGTRTDYSSTGLNEPMLSSRWHAIVPAKRLKDAKSRLGRDDLTIPFLTDVLSALRTSSRVHDVTVITADDSYGQIAKQLGCQIILEESNAGLLPAINQGVSAHRNRGEDTLLVVLGDLPCLTSGQVDLFIDQGSQYDCAFLPDAEGTGSTMWMAQSPTQNPQFGARSRAAHRESGAVEISHPELRGARRDVDTQVNLWDAIRIGVGPATRAAIESDSPTTHMVVTISTLDPLSGVDESGHVHPLPRQSLLGIKKPRVGQRMVIPAVHS